MADSHWPVPRTDMVTADPRLPGALATLDRIQVKAAVVGAQERVRRGEIDPDEVPTTVVRALPQTGPATVLKATGVVLHTSLVLPTGGR
jgi:L-seryl-tRNA(Ser) seleniumtransferase